jgi:hypothetical protein
MYLPSGLNRSSRRGVRSGGVSCDLLKITGDNWFPPFRCLTAACLRIKPHAVKRKPHQEKDQSGTEVFERSHRLRTIVSLANSKREGWRLLVRDAVVVKAA